MNKRKITCFFLLLCLSLTLILSPQAVNANGAEAIYSIDVTIDLLTDGSANITQVWHTQLNSGTELYIPQMNLGDIEFKDFQVSDPVYGQYENIGDWDIDASFEEKAGKCGFNYLDDGLELCWGKTQFGENTYTLTYNMSNFVKEYADGAFGFYSRFVNSELEPSPAHISVTIQQDGAEFSADNAGIWGLGYHGSIVFTDDGKVMATSSEHFTPESHATILMRLDQSLITHAAKSDRTFSELEDMALEGSDYDMDEAYENVYDEAYEDNYHSNSSPFSGFFGIISGAAVLIPILAALGIFGSHAKAGGSKNIAPPIDEKNLAYYRDIPFNGYLPPAFYVLDNYRQLGNKSDIISAYFLRWIKAGVVTVETRDKKTFLGLGSKAKTSLVLHNPPVTDSALETELYTIMRKAAGSDQVLQEKELQTWSSNNYSTLSAWFDRVEKEGENHYLRNQLATSEQQPYFFNMFKRKVTKVNNDGIVANENLLGFKKYLKDYTLVAERHAQEVILWDEYLVFASLFGIADQVAKEFKKLNPQFFEAPMYQQNNGDFFTTYLFLRALSNAGYKGMEAGKFSSDGTRSGGGGGFSSFGGGGGGFSGGGSGGGSR